MNMNKTDKILSAVMGRYGGLCALYDAICDDYDTVLANLEADSGIDMDSIDFWINVTISGGMK